MTEEDAKEIHAIFEVVSLRKNIRKMMKGAGNAEYVIFDEGN